MNPDVLDRLPLIADGAPGAALRRAWPKAPAPVEALNLEAPERVQALHAQYAQAGAVLVRTNTAQASAVALARYGLAVRAEAVNNSGAACVRGAVGPQGIMMGTVGMMAPQAASEPERTRAYAEQAVYLSDTGVTFVLLHHFDRLDEARRATREIARASDAPVLAALTPDAAGRTADGAGLEEAARALLEAGAGALGLACSPHLWSPRGELRRDWVRTLLAVAAAEGVPVSVMPGLAVAGETPARGPALSPEDFAAALAPLAAEGVAILGGCCGVWPEHTAALVRACGH